MKLSEVMAQQEESPKRLKLSEVMAQQEQSQAEPEVPQTIEDHVLSFPGMKPIAELAAAANKSMFQFLDFLGPDNVNAVLELVGSNKQVPTLSENLASDGGYMEPGLARDAVQSAGALLPAAAGMTPVTGRNLATAKGATEELVGLGSAKVVEPIKVATAAISEAPPIKAATDAISDALPSKAKDAAKLPLYRRSGDIAAAGFKLDDYGRVIPDKLQKNAIKAGIDPGAVSMLSAANKHTRSRVKDMIEVINKGKENLEYRSFNTPQTVVGEALEQRLSIILKANKEAAGKLDEVAEGLKNQSVDISSAMDRFVERLAKERINVGSNGKLDFTGSSIEGKKLRKAQSVIGDVYERLRYTADPSENALRVHDAKKFIDEQVSYGKSQAGLSGRMENIIKELRHNLDSILDKNFHEYDSVNTMYAETRSEIDKLQALAGSAVDLTGPNVESALGTLSRKALSNYSTGTATQNIFDTLDKVASRYSTPLTGSPQDNLKQLVVMEAELRKMFPNAAKPNTFQGEIGAEVMRGTEAVVTGEGTLNPLKMGINAAKKMKDAFSGDEDAKLKALKDLLDD